MTSSSVATRCAKSTKHRSGRLGLLACVCIGLAAVQPGLRYAELPQAHDTLFHLHRLVQLNALLRQGVFFSRWSPYLARGFGYPLFNYYGPLSYYVAAAFHLIGIPMVLAFAGTFVLSVVAAAIGMYLWVRDLFGERAGLVAAASYVLTPSLVGNVTTRMAFAEQFAFGLLPFVLFSLSRLATQRRFRYIILTSLLLAFVVATHNVTAILFMPFVMNYVALLAANSFRATPSSVPTVQQNWGRAGFLAQACSAILLAMSLSAFYWLPVLVERDLVQLDRLTIWSVFDYRLNFMHLESIFPFPEIVDPHLINRTSSVGLSLLTALLAVAGTLGMWRWRPSGLQGLHIAFAVLAASAAMLMVLPVSAPVWATLQPLRLLQFPWRFLGVANLFLSLLAGAAVRAIEGQASSTKGVGATFAIVATFAMLAWVAPWQLVPRYHSFAEDPTIDDIIRYEHDTGSIGTTTTGEYLPTSVSEYPPPGKNTSYYDRARFNQDSLPQGAHLLAAYYQPLEYWLVVETPHPFTAIFDTFHFPGWRAWVDGSQVSVTATEPYGLIGVPVPEGRHVIRVAFGPTPVRAWGSLTSVTAAGALIGVVVLRAIRRHRGSLRSAGKVESGLAHQDSQDLEGSALARPPRPIATAPHDHLLPDSAALALMGAMVAFIVVKSNWIDPVWVRYQRTHFDVVTNTNFANRLILVGADRPATIRSGEEATIALYWRVPVETENEFSTSIHIVDARGYLSVQSDNCHPGGISTAQWTPSTYARDLHTIRIPVGTPPGRYGIQVAAYPVDRPWDALDVLDASGAPVGRMVKIGTLEIARPRRWARSKDVASGGGRVLASSEGLALLGYSVTSAEVRTGESIPLALLWQAVESPKAGSIVRLRLLDASGVEVYAEDVSPVPGYDTAHWQRGDIWRGMHALPIPAHLSGWYMLGVGLPSEEQVLLAPLNVIAPKHVLEMPTMSHRVSALFGDLVSLTGYDVQGTAGPNQAVRVILAWRVVRQTREPYKTFVHLLDADGRLLVGSDSVADEWRRPSPGWVVGEYIIDQHSLSFPQVSEDRGPFRLAVGIYHAVTQSRLPLEDGTDALILSQVMGAQP